MPLPAFCERCKKYHGIGMACIPGTPGALSSVGSEREISNLEVEGSSPSGPANPVFHGVEFVPDKFPGQSKPFDRIAYQRDYARDLPKAKAEGLTVKQWRDKHKEGI